jgi:Na+-transporting NADH:ubiquinone oxidoreductase subunit NqrB
MPRLVPPSRDDPRLRLALVIVTLQVLGQAVLGFKVSIAQILVSIAVCAAAEVGMDYWKKSVIAWPASAILTGNSVAFILRAAGTRHGDWWSLNGIEWFVLASLGGLLSKYLLRAGGRHLYNPSNLGLVGVFLLVGAQHVYPQPLWWGPLDGPVLLALAVIVAGGLWVLHPLRMLPMTAAFLGAFGLLVGGLALGGACFAAAWSPVEVCGGSYWLNLVASPELLVFVFFMISDPRTAPEGGRARLVYGIAVGVLAAGLVGLEPSEYGVKVALLAALTVVCSVVPMIERLAAGGWSRLLFEPVGQPSARSALVAVAAVLLMAAVPIGTLGLARDPLALASDGNPRQGIKATQR